MRLCIIANGYPTKDDAQYGCFEKDQALALKELGHEVSILYVDGRFRTYKRKFGITHIKEDGLNIYGIYYFPTRLLSIINYKWTYRLRIHLLNKLFRHSFAMSSMPDVIYAHYCYNIANAVPISKKYGIPLVGIEHWSVMNQPVLPSNAVYLGRVAYKNSDALLAVSESLATSINNRFGILPTVVNDMVGGEFIREELTESTDTHFRFIAIGSLIPRKGFDLLIEAFNKSGLYNRSSEVIIIGSGPEQDNLQALINKYNLQAYVRLVGRKNKQEIIEFLKGSNAFVLSSHVETFGVVCIEAMALGVPVIATICGGPEEFINDDNGILINTNNIDELSSALIEMYDNKDKYNKFRIAEECRAKFAPNVIARKLSQIFDETVNNYKLSK